MLEFSEQFFEEEEREGFLVPEKMKRAWASEMNVLSEVIRVCRKYHLTYYAIYGTLLGTVRHKGYIPWDDDIDIALKRADYAKLMQILPYELPEGFVVSSNYTDVPHNQPISCVMNSARLLSEEEAKTQFYGCPYIVGVDVYALDYVPREPEICKLWTKMYSMVYDAAQRSEELQASGEMEQYLPQIEELCNVKLNSEQPLKKQLWRLSDQIAGMFREDECDDLTYLTRAITWDPEFRLKKEWFEHTLELPYENIQVSVPENYDEILKKLYGDDYMQPLQIGGAHEYPFYKKQDTYLNRG